MAWIGAAIGAAGSLLGGSKASKGAKAGAAAQAEATRLGVEEQRRQFDLINSQQRPYRGVGNNALYALSDMAGLPGYFGSDSAFTNFGAGGGGSPLTEAQIRQNLIASGQYSNPDNEAFYTDRLTGKSLFFDPHAKNLGEHERNIWRNEAQGYEGSVENLISRLNNTDEGGYYIGAGGSGGGGLNEAALNKAIQDQLAAQGGAGGAGGGAERTPYNWQTSPAYNFRFDEGERAANRAYGAAGNRISGNRITGLQNYGQRAASQEFENQFGRLAQLAGFGQGSTAVTAGAAQNTGHNNSALYSQQGQANNAAATSAGQYSAAGTLGAFRGLGGAFNSSGGSFGGTNYAGINSGLDNVFSDPSLF